MQFKFSGSLEYRTRFGESSWTEWKSLVNGSCINTYSGNTRTITLQKDISYQILYRNGGGSGTGTSGVYTIFNNELFKIAGDDTNRLSLTVGENSNTLAIASYTITSIIPLSEY